MTPLLRRAARLLVVDAENKVLLFQYEDGPRRWWVTPGGGLEGEETFEEAAAREAVEELSVTRTPLVPLWRQPVEFTFRGRSIRQVEQYYLMRLSPHDAGLVDTVRAVHRREGVVAARWWTADEIATTTEEVFPRGLAERLRDLGRSSGQSSGA